MIVAVSKLLLASCLVLIVDASVPFSKDDLPKLNGARRAMAGELGIANMHELSWSVELEDHVKTKATCDRPFDYSGSGRVILESADARYRAITNQKELDELLVAAGSTGLSTARVKEISAHPTQTKIACVKMDCSAGFKQVAACIMGPEKEFKKEMFKKGAAGSACGGGSANDGLCASSGGSSGGGGGEEPAGSPSQASPAKATTTSSAADSSIALFLFNLLMIQLVV